MAIENTILIIDRLIEHLENQNIEINGKSFDDVEDILLADRLLLPADFKSFYSIVNGMESFYPNDTDDEGFLIYPFEAVISAHEEMENPTFKNSEFTFIFADYMHNSWQYAYQVNEDGSYLIGIIPEDSTFKPITHSLFDFIQLYIEDSEVLYDYEM